MNMLYLYTSIFCIDRISELIRPSDNTDMFHAEAEIISN